MAYLGEHTDRPDSKGGRWRRVTRLLLYEDVSFEEPRRGGRKEDVVLDEDLAGVEGVRAEGEALEVFDYRGHEGVEGL